MITTTQSGILGVVQGFTEFLPISSSAHLVLFPYFFQWEDPGLGYDVALHMGTLAAILGYFWKDWTSILRNFVGYFRSKAHRSGESLLWAKLIVGTFPAAIAGIVLEKTAETQFRSPYLIATTLSVFAFLLLFADRKGSKTRDISSISFSDAILIGCAQSVAIIPGVSRSGITITTALLLGLTRKAGARFSFLLSAPIIAGAGLMKSETIVESIRMGGESLNLVVVGFATSLISGLTAIALLNYIMRTRSLAGFAYYRFALSFIIIVIAVIFR